MAAKEHQSGRAAAILDALTGPGEHLSGQAAHRRDAPATVEHLSGQAAHRRDAPATVEHLAGRAGAILDALAGPGEHLPRRAAAS